MGKYLKKFETQATYETAYQSLILPNVSLTVDNNTVHYNPLVPETRVVVKYNITDTTNPTQLWLYTGNNVFKYIEIDGEEVSSATTGYTFDTVGIHTVKYELVDETSISNNNTPLFYNSLIVDVFIPDSVETIGYNAFYNCSSFTSCTIGSGVTTIDSNAFYGCRSLTNVNMPYNLETIGSYAFYMCSGLTSIVIPDSVTNIGQNAFKYCTNLTSITVDNSNTVYDSRNNCNAIIESATDKLIVGCKNTIIPNTVTNIGDYAFDGCSSLTSIIIPDSVTSIGDYAFRNCSGLTNITSNATTAPTIQSNTFQDVKTGGTLTVPSGSSGYDVWMGTGDYYLGKYDWTKVEQ